MKKEELEDKLFEIDRKREIKMVAVFDANHMPIIGVPEIRRGRDWSDSTAGHITDLSQFRAEFEKLNNDELFVFGRLSECNHRLGLDEVRKYFKKHDNSEENAEYYYMRNCCTIGRLHCFVKKMSNGKFALFDCSLAGTCIVC